MMNLSHHIATIWHVVVCGTLAWGLLDRLVSYRPVVLEGLSIGKPVYAAVQ